MKIPRTTKHNTVTRFLVSAFPSLLRPSAILNFTSSPGSVEITALVMIRMFSKPITTTTKGNISLRREREREREREIYIEKGERQRGREIQ